MLTRKPYAQLSGPWDCTGDDHVTSASMAHVIDRFQTKGIVALLQGKLPAKEELSGGTAPERFTITAKAVMALSPTTSPSR